MFYVLLILIAIAIIFIFIILKSNNISYSGDNSSIETFTSDVVDDDLDDPYQENDWNDVAYNENDFEEDDFNFELYDDMYDE